MRFLFVVVIVGFLPGAVLAQEDQRCDQLRAAHAAGMASQFSKAQVAAARAWYGRNCNGQTKRREASR